MTNRIDYAKASPGGYRAFGGVYVHVQKSGLAPELVNLVYLRVSQINGCAFCIDMHTRDLLKSGVAVSISSRWYRSGGMRVRFSAAASATLSAGPKP